MGMKTKKEKECLVTKARDKCECDSCVIARKFRALSIQNIIRKLDESRKEIINEWLKELYPTEERKMKGEKLRR